ncbi:hamartin isoform X2 [Daktulosphaira vitifoliae]|uniref:hamartin isoform X2 n=1 Tax=Daktulosphaira vitifoliae TaxID=58002 RepID=UPI0021A99902|nr:hamartin isoform X2 [Daktulosphaira vitifoliae]
MIAMEVMELFTALESNQAHEVEDVKHKFHEQFNSTREPWLLNGMYDYFMSTGSQRAVEVLVAIREPHDKYLFDRLGDGLRSSSRLQALTLLGHVVKRQPTWLFKITNHSLIKDLIRILKVENEIITITSALLVLNVLLTVIPALIASSLSDIFEGFSRLAAWNTSHKHRAPEIHLFHLQISLYVLFVQLYSMYPCSFVSFLKLEYSKKDNHVVFNHTIKPMLETMRMHPSLVVSSKDLETSTARWKKMEQHDVVMECTRYTLMENSDRNYQSSSSWNTAETKFSSALEVLKSSIRAAGNILSPNINKDKEIDLWSPMLHCGEFHCDSVQSIPTTPNLQNYYTATLLNQNENSPPEAAIEATPESTPIRITETNKEENIRSEAKPIANPLQLMSSSDIMQNRDEDLIECDQQSNGSPCQTHEGGLHMPDSASFKEFIISVRTRRRYYSQCTPEKTMGFIGPSTGSSPREGTDFSIISVRRANSCPEIKKTNGNNMSNGTTPLQEESEDDHGDSRNISNGHSCISSKNTKKENQVTKRLTVSTQTEHILPYEHLFYCLFPAYNDSQNSNKNKSYTNFREDESLCLVEKYVRTSAIVLNHRHTAASCEDVKLLQDQVSLLTLQLQFERNRREVHAERNRRLLGKSRTSRALDEHNSALKDQVIMLETEFKSITSELEKLRQLTRNQINELKENVSHLQTECSKYQEETKAANKNCQELEQLYNQERMKTFEVTKQLSETKGELFNTLSELSIVQAAADISKELKNTVTNLQRELVISGEMQSRQRDIVTHVNALKYDATNVMLSQESYKHHTRELQDMVHKKTAELEATNSRIAELELRLKIKDASLQNEKREIERVKEHYSKQIAELEEECRILKEMQCRYHQNELEELSKRECLTDIPKFNTDIKLVNTNSPISSQGAEFRLNMMLAKNDEESDENHDVTLPI